MILIFFVLQSFASEAQTKANVILPFDEPWFFWAGKAAPSEWPIQTTPTAKDARTLVPKEIAESPDRWAYIQKESLFTTENHWWDGFLAPFSIRNQEQFERYLPIIKKSQRKRKRKGLLPYSRTELVHEKGGLDSIFFYKDIHIEDPTIYDVLQIEAKFTDAIDVYVNDSLVLSEKKPLSTDKTYPSFYQFDVGRSDRWQYSWQGLPNRLQKGKNTISVRINKSVEAQNPVMYFDLKIKGHKIDWLKKPYLMNPTKNSIVLGYETTAPTSAEVEVCQTKNSSACTLFKGSKEKTLHQIKITDLLPNTSYTYEARYSFQGKTYTYPKQTFRSLPAQTNEFSFYLYGDSRANEKVHAKLANAIAKDNEKNQASFVVHTGDIVTHGYIWDLWETKFFQPTENLFRTIPVIPVLGNHEQNQKLYYDYFDLPHNESWYSFVQDNTEFFALNTNVPFGPSSEQYKWFEKKLKESSTKWKIVIFHHPPFSCSPVRKPGAMGVRKHLVPLMEQYNVDLVLLGHDHLYGRSESINGVIYITSGGGGAGLYGAESDEFNPVCIKKHHYVYFEVTNHHISWKAVDLAGNVIDSFTLQ